MTNKPMLSVERELLERLASSFSSAYACAQEDSYSDSDAEAVLAELRELLGRPTPQYPLEGGGPGAPKFLGEPLAVFSLDSTGCRARLLLDYTKPFPADGTLLYAGKSAVQAVSLPDFESSCGHLVEMAKDINGEYMNSYAIIGSQIWEAARLNGVKT